MHMKHDLCAVLISSSDAHLTEFQREIQQLSYRKQDVNQMNAHYIKQHKWNIQFEQFPLQPNRPIRIEMSNISHLISFYFRNFSPL